MNLNHVLKKVGRRSSHDLFSNWYFLNLHALGYLKPVTVFFYPTFGLTSPSAWCGYYTVGRRRRRPYTMSHRNKTYTHVHTPTGLHFVSSIKTVQKSPAKNRVHRVQKVLNLLKVPWHVVQNAGGHSIYCLHGLGGRKRRRRRRRRRAAAAWQLHASVCIIILPATLAIS
jgi:hypothetical protein